MGREGRTDEVLASVTEMAARLLPTKEEAGRAAANGGVERLLGQAHWAEGRLHRLSGRAARRGTRTTWTGGYDAPRSPPGYCAAALRSLRDRNRGTRYQQATTGADVTAVANQPL